MSVRDLPALAPARRLKLPRTVEATLPNGLTVIATRRPSVPLVEMRLRIPFPRANVARGMLLAETMLSGTTERSNVEISAALQEIGGQLSVSADSDRVLVGGNALAPGLPGLLGLLAEVLSGAAYPAGEVAAERGRLADHIRVAKTQAGYVARQVLNRELYGRHPYAVQTAEPEQIAAVRPAALRTLHAERIHPAGATLVIVGDVPPQRAIDAAETALSTWNGGGKTFDLPPVPVLTGGPITLVNRPGSVQSSVRVGLNGVGRSHPDHAALQLANLIFGGYFSSRLVENIRESKGYTYSPRSTVEHSVAGSSVVVSAETATEVTAAALVETRYELGRIATTRVSAEELTQARQYALGTLQLGVATQAGLAGLMSGLAGHGLRLEWLAEHAGRLSAATAGQVSEVAARYYAPANAVTVILGDADAVAPELARVDHVVRD